MGLHRFCAVCYFINPGRGGGQRAVRGDLRNGLLGVRVLWFLSRLGFNNGHRSERTHSYSHKGQVMGDTGNPHG